MRAASNVTQEKQTVHPAGFFKKIARWIALSAVIVRRDPDNVPLPLTAGNPRLWGKL
jgi:hypothetical protein